MSWNPNGAIGTAAIALLIACAACDEGSQDPNDLRNVKVSLIEAIAAAEAEVPDGIALEGELEREDGEALYAVEMLEPDQLSEVLVDSDDASIVEIEIEDNDGDLEEAAEDAAALAGSQVTLRGAIETAEQHVDGRAVEIEISEPYLEVAVLPPEEGTQAVLVRINLSDGEIMEVGDAPGDSDDGDDGE